MNTLSACERCVLSYLCNPDEDLELVDMELLIHTLSEPGSQQVHGGSVPLLKHINTTLSSKTHTHAHTQDTMTQNGPLGATANH